MSNKSQRTSQTSENKQMSMAPDDMMKTTAPKDPEEGQQGLEPEPQPAYEDLEVHPIAELFPVMDAHTFESLKASIASDGLHHPLVDLRRGTS